LILRRLGNKKKIAGKIQQYFPKHTLYIEFFFGAGGMFFNKPKAKYNIVNDNDSEVFNLFSVLKARYKDLERKWYETPLNEELWQHWRSNSEIDPVWQAVRFLYLSNLGYMGKPNTFRFVNGNLKKVLLDNIERAYEMLNDVDFMNFDFREVLPKISLLDENDFTNAFIYADPPYLGTDNNYETGFTEQDSADLFNVLIDSKIKFAIISEFDNPFILETAKEKGLYITNIGERVNMKNRRTEILVTNYVCGNTLFD
jgi:DNA adenine methylase